MTDIWVCSTCHSINRQRGSTCYKCGAPQSAAVEVLADVRTELAMQSRAAVPYRTSILRAIVAAAFIVAYAVLGVIVLVQGLAVTQYLRDEIPNIFNGQVDNAEIIRLAAPAVVPALLQTICGLGALVFFAAWLSRVVMNIPSLGGGTPRTTPTNAFIYPLIPFWNLFKTPPIIQDALYRVDPKAGGFFMILLAWVGLVGSAIIGFLVGWWVNLRIATIPGNATRKEDAILAIQDAYDTQILVDVVTTLMASAGAVVLVLVMFRIEARARARDREIRKIAAAPRPEPGRAVPRPRGASQGSAAPMAGGSPAPTADGSPAPVAAPVAAAVVPGPLGFVPAAAAPAPADAAPAAPVAHVPTGPRLHLRIDSPTAMIATLKGESEAILLDELPATAAALARADGSAVIAWGDGGIEARPLADWAFQVLTNAHVPTTMEG
jgi:hypothetical protein